MAIIKCPDCKNDVSDKASSCPNCGYPIDKMDILYYRDIKDDEICEIHTLTIQEKFYEAINKCSDLLSISKNRQVLKKELVFMISALDKHINECRSEYEDIKRNNIKVNDKVYRFFFLGGIISMPIPFIILNIPSFSNWYLILFVPLAILGLIITILSVLFLISDDGEDKDASAYKEMCKYGRQKQLCMELLNKYD